MGWVPASKHAHIWLYLLMCYFPEFNTPRYEIDHIVLGITFPPLPPKNLTPQWSFLPMLRPYIIKLTAPFLSLNEGKAATAKRIILFSKISHTSVPIDAKHVLT